MPICLAGIAGGARHFDCRWAIRGTSGDRQAP